MSAASLQAASGTTAAAQAKYGIASPLLNGTFTMSIPAGVNVLASTSSPKLATTPTFDNTTRVLTWALGTTVAPGKSVELSLKMQPTACSTPPALALNGRRFAFKDATGPKTVGACLKKPVRGSGTGDVPAVTGWAGLRFIRNSNDDDNNTTQP